MQGYFKQIKSQHPLCPILRTMLLYELMTSYNVKMEAKHLNMNAKDTHTMLGVEKIAIW